MFTGWKFQCQSEVVNVAKITNVIAKSMKATNVIAKSKKA